LLGTEDWPSLGLELVVEGGIDVAVEVDKMFELREVTGGHSGPAAIVLPATPREDVVREAVGGFMRVRGFADSAIEGDRLLLKTEVVRTGRTGAAVKMDGLLKTDETLAF